LNPVPPEYETGVLPILPPAFGKENEKYIQNFDRKNLKEKATSEALV
jgi:hypothetical protein